MGEKGGGGESRRRERRNKQGAKALRPTAGTFLERPMFGTKLSQTNSRSQPVVLLFPPPSMIILGCSRSKVKARRAPRFVLQIKATSGYVAGAASLAASQETRRKKGT